MNFLTVTLTTAKKMPPPAKLPDIAREDAVSWFDGWWAGICVGCIIGTGIGVLLASSIL